MLAWLAAGTNEDTILMLLTSRSNDQRQDIKAVYKKTHGKVSWAAGGETEPMTSCRQSDAWLLVMSPCPPRHVWTPKGTDISDGLFFKSGADGIQCVFWKQMPYKEVTISLLYTIHQSKYIFLQDKFEVQIADITSVSSKQILGRGGTIWLSFLSIL